MTVSGKANSTKHRPRKGDPVITDIDKTLLKGDTGKEWLTKAGKVNPEQWSQFVQNYDYEGLGHGNQLLNYLSQNQDRLDNLEDHIPEVDISARQGIDQILDYRAEQDILNAGSSAGYQKVIESATNGNLHEIIAGELNQNGKPIFNGEQQKKDRVDSLRARIGHQGQYYALADSNGDRTLIEGAHKSGGAGIGIGSSITEAKERIDQATYYVGDSNPEHELTGALISHLSINEPYKLTPQELRKEYGFDYTTAEIQTGELADKEDRKILNNFLNQLN